MTRLLNFVYNCFQATGMSQVSAHSLRTFFESFDFVHSRNPSRLCGEF